MNCLMFRIVTQVFHPQSGTHAQTIIQDSIQPQNGPINLEEIINSKNMSQDVLLLPYDIVFLPKSPVGNVNKWMQLYIRNNLPIIPGFGVYYNP